MRGDGRSAAAAESEAWLAVRRVDCHADAVIALQVDLLGLAVRAVREVIRAADQRSCVGQPVLAGRRARGEADWDDAGARDGQPRGGLGRVAGRT